MTQRSFEDIIKDMRELEAKERKLYKRHMMMLNLSLLSSIIAMGLCIIAMVLS